MNKRTEIGRDKYEDLVTWIESKFTQNNSEENLDELVIEMLQSLGLDVEGPSVLMFYDERKCVCGISDSSDCMCDFLNDIDL